jgi:hypothetical protein
LDNKTKKKDWGTLRSEIESIVKELGLSKENFYQLSVHGEWKSIEEKVYSKFCKIDHFKSEPIWLWEYFILDVVSISVVKPWKYLPKIINKDENIFFFINDEANKFWFYEGKIETIVEVILKSSYLNELYFLSKKYEWLVCINHHDVLYATGSVVPERLRQLISSL